MRLKYKNTYLNFFYPFNINRLFGFSKDNHLFYHSKEEIESHLNWMKEQINKNDSLSNQDKEKHLKILSKLVIVD